MELQPGGITEERRPRLGPFSREVFGARIGKVTRGKLPGSLIGRLILRFPQKVKIGAREWLHTDFSQGGFY